jgi:hypothetical protein
LDFQPRTIANDYKTLAYNSTNAAVAKQLLQARDAFWCPFRGNDEKELKQTIKLLLDSYATYFELVMKDELKINSQPESEQNNVYGISNPWATQQPVPEGTTCEALQCAVAGREFYYRFLQAFGDDHVTPYIWVQGQHTYFQQVQRFSLGRRRNEREEHFHRICKSIKSNNGGGKKVGQAIIDLGNSLVTHDKFGFWCQLRHQYVMHSNLILEELPNIKRKWGWACKEHKDKVLAEIEKDDKSTRKALEDAGIIKPDKEAVLFKTHFQSIADRVNITGIDWKRVRNAHQDIFMKRHKSRAKAAPSRNFAIDAAAPGMLFLQADTGSRQDIWQWEHVEHKTEILQALAKKVQSLSTDNPGSGIDTMQTDQPITLSKRHFKEVAAEVGRCYIDACRVEAVYKAYSGNLQQAIEESKQPSEVHPTTAGSTPVDSFDMASTILAPPLLAQGMACMPKTLTANTLPAVDGTLVEHLVVKCKKLDQLEHGAHYEKLTIQGMPE